MTPTLDVVLPILQGLLASGHYTFENNNVAEIDSGFIRDTDGEIIAVEDAIEIATELVKELQLRGE